MVFLHDRAANQEMPGKSPVCLFRGTSRFRAGFVLPEEWRRQMFTNARSYLFDLEWATRSAATLKHVGTKAVVKFLRTWRNRRDINRLHDLDDWQLNDIGLCRHDVWQGSRGSFFDDPSKHLTTAARRRSRNLGMDD
jgi:uncharacterized protein YjiS (DUF1127 family)